MRISGQEIIDRCRRIAAFSESSTETTRTFLCPAMHDVHAFLGEWMESLGMNVWLDAIGNLHGIYPAHDASSARRLLIGSHLDTVPNAGAFDGVLGVVLGIALVQELAPERLPFAVEIIGFAEEEGVRFGIPFLGSRALVGRIADQLPQLAAAIRGFGLNPQNIDEALLNPGAFAYLEFHIEQGPVLEHLNLPLGVVEAIAGQTRYAIRFIGTARHAGTTPMRLRQDALAGASEWIIAVENEAKSIEGLVATVGAIHSEPQASNVIPGLVSATLDVRHASDSVRRQAAGRLLESGASIAALRGLRFQSELRLDQAAVAMDTDLVSLLQSTIAGAPLMTSGAGHDAMVVAEKVSSVMLFLRSPGGISHHPDESVLPKDVELAVSAGLNFVRELAERVS